MKFKLIKIIMQLKSFSEVERYVAFETFLLVEPIFGNVLRIPKNVVK